MAVRPGYKQTEVGVIPDDWRLLPLGAFASCFSGGTPNTAVPRYYGGSVKWITSSDLNRGVITDVPGRISEEGLAESSAKMVRPGTLLVALYGATAGVCAITTIEAALNQAVLALLTAPECSEFFYYYLCFRKDHYVNTFTQGGQPNLSGEIVKSFAVPLPPLPEQRAIAEALGDVDALLAAQDQLIAKRRDIKQATMQQLLTGKTRLPGFSGEWEVKKLGEMFALTGGVPASRAQLTDTGYCYLHYGDIHGASGTTVDTKSQYISIPKLQVDLRRVPPGALLEDGDVVFVDASEDEDGSSKHVVVRNTDRLPFIAGLHTTVAKGVTSDLTHPYRQYCFQTREVRDQFRYHAVGTKVLGVSKGKIGSIVVQVPQPAEQRAIATVLSDIDAEIEALEQQRDKTRLLKQGMMQELLTGRTRLV